MLASFTLQCSGDDDDDEDGEDGDNDEEDDDEDHFAYYFRVYVICYIICAFPHPIYISAAAVSQDHYRDITAISCPLLAETKMAGNTIIIIGQTQVFIDH